MTMSHTELNGSTLKSMLDGGYRYLRKNTDTIDDLNVFPVPDGDTGTNMTLTLSGGVSDSTDFNDVSDMMQSFARGTLFSARGNSGVILSQFIKGLGLGCKDKSILTINDFTLAFGSGVKCAYESVMKPVEGTILTVMRETYEYLVKNQENFSDFEAYFSALIDAAKQSLARTPELLPVLKDAGVIDSGGAGFICILEGAKMALLGENIYDGNDSFQTFPTSTVSASSFSADSELLYGYCTEFILQLQNSKTDISSFSTEPMKEFLSSVGDSIVIVNDADIVKVHVHTFVPEEVMAYARKFGEFITIKIENMSVQHSETVSKKQETEQSEHVKYAIVAVASGEGISSYFKEIGVSGVINGGQTNNPSTEDMIEAFKRLNCEHIIVLPNNSNIIMTARQAAELYDGADVHVIPTRSIAEGYSALSMMDIYCDTVDEVIDSMTAYLGDVTTGYVTTATRDTEMNNVSIKKGNYIGLDGESILYACDSKTQTVIGMLKNLKDIDEKQVITFFYGMDVTDEELDRVKADMKSEFPLIETGFIDGGQDVYSFILSIE